MNPVQRELHEKQQERFSQTAAGLPYSSHTSPSGKVYDVYGRRTGFTSFHSVAMVTERCVGAVNGHTRKEAARYYGFSPVTLLSDLEDEDLVRDVLAELRTHEPKEDEAFLREVANALISAFNVEVLNGI